MKKKTHGKICSRNNCSIKSNVKVCKYCNDLFCKKHILGFAPHVGIDESWDKRKDPDSGHPCYNTVLYKENQEKEREEEYRKNLGLLLDRNKKNKIYNSYTKYNITKNKHINHKSKYNKINNKWKNVKTNNNKSKKKIHEIAIGRFEAKQKKKNNKKIIPIKKILYFIFIVGIIIIAYFNWGQIILFINNLDNGTEILNKTTIDTQTLEAFNYINNYRLDSGSSKLEYSKDLYELIKVIAKEKDINPDSFKSNSEFLEIVKSQFDTSGISYSFYETYFIKGEGLDKFHKEFDKNYGARNLIKNSKYNYGAVYCGLDYCILFVYTSTNEIKPIIENEITKKSSLAFVDLPTKKISIAKYEINPKFVNLPEIGNFEVYGGLDDYLSGLPKSIYYFLTPPTNKDFIIKDIDNTIQDLYLLSLVEKIKEKYPSSDEQARAAIRLVQKIPYDYDGLYGTPEGRLPYEVVYDMSGVCSEKSKLLIYILRELEFGVATFEFESENHQAVGIKCPSCDYQNSGYCFIESTSPTIPTDSEGEYIGAGKLGGPSEIINIADGKSLDLSEECGDAKEWNNIASKGEILSNYDYDKWQKLVDKYDMEIEGYNI